MSNKKEDIGIQGDIADEAADENGGESNAECNEHECHFTWHDT